jgi:hypothetical protein
MKNQARLDYFGSAGRGLTGRNIRKAQPRRSNPERHLVGLSIVRGLCHKQPSSHPQATKSGK